MFVNVGMWLERFVIIVTSLHRDFMPSAWDTYSPTRWDFMTFFGTIGLFLALMFLFIRFLPMISIFEMRTMVPEAKVEEEDRGVIGRGRHRTPLYGLMAEFETPTDLVRAAHAAHAAGYRRVDAYSPYPIEEVSEALGHHRSKMPLLVLGGGLTGAAAGFGLAYWSSVIAYPMNIGGKPLQQLAGVHRADLRDDDPVRRAGGGARHAGAERPADAVPPGLQRAELRARLEGSLLPVHRGARPQVRLAATRDFLEHTERGGGARS